MLRVRPEQYQALASESRRRYAARLINHLRDTFPLQTGMAEDGAMTAFVALAMDQAMAIGIDTEASVQSFADHLLLLGADFPRNPLCQEICAPLFDSELISPVQRIDELHDLAWPYLEGVRGPDGVDQIQAAARLRAWMANRGIQRGVGLDELLEALRRIYPTRAMAHPRAVLSAFCEEALRRAGEDNFSQTPARALYVCTAFVAGLGFFHDPLIRAGAAAQATALDTETDPGQRTALLWQGVDAYLRQLLEQVQQASGRDEE